MIHDPYEDEDPAEEIECINTHGIVCPYCGYEHSDCWEYTEDVGLVDCGECEKRFSYCRDTTITYSTCKKRL